MSEKKEAFETLKNNNGVHLMGSINGEYAICGDAFDGYERMALPTHKAMSKTTKKIVTCKNCLREIRNVKAYLKSKGSSC